jgi:hypothetical protein
MGNDIRLLWPPRLQWIQSPERFYGDWRAQRKKNAFLTAREETTLRQLKRNPPVRAAVALS